MQIASFDAIGHSQPLTVADQHRIVIEFRDPHRGPVRSEYLPTGQAKAELQRIVTEARAAREAGEERWVSVGETAAFLTSDIIAVRLEVLALPGVGASPRQSIWDMKF
jgi:hypothetical protein